MTYSIPHVHADPAIGNFLSMSKSQQTGIELAWVDLIHSAESTDLVITPDASVPAGTYTLTLESRDQNSKVGSVLSTEEITIVVTQPPPPSFVQRELIVPGKAKEWSLAAIQGGDYPHQKVELSIGPDLQPFISYDSLRNMIQFSGSRASLKLAKQIVTIKYSLRDHQGNSSKEFTLVLAVISADQLPASELPASEFPAPGLPGSEPVAPEQLEQKQEIEDLNSASTSSTEGK